jgi:hypothetical protein
MMTSNAAGRPLSAIERKGLGSNRVEIRDEKLDDGIYRCTGQQLCPAVLSSAPLAASAAAVRSAAGRWAGSASAAFTIGDNPDGVSDGIQHLRA